MFIKCDGYWQFRCGALWITKVHFPSTFTIWLGSWLLYSRGFENL